MSARNFLFLLLVCLPLPIGAACKKVNGETFVVCIPNQAILARSEGKDLDFITYSITGEGLPSVVIYEGNQPQAMPSPKGVKIRRQRFGEFRGVSHTYQSAGAKVSFVQLRSARRDWPQFIEFSFVTRNEDEAEYASEMLRSMSRRVRRTSPEG